MEKKKLSKKMIPYAAVSSLAVILVAGGIFAYTGVHDEPTKKESTPKTSMNTRKSKEPSQNTRTSKARKKSNPTLGAVIAKVEEKASTTGITSSSVVANSPVEQILQTLARVPDKAPVVASDAPVVSTPEIVLPETPNDVDAPPIIKPEDPQIPISPEEPIVPDEPSIPEVVNEPPTIEASNQEVGIGSQFNPGDYATASDKEDGDITSAIQVIANNVNIHEEGTYQITYQVMDSKGATAEKTITVTIVNERPEITAIDQQVSLGDTFNPLEGVSAKDKEDGDITNSIQVVSNNVDTSVEGSYQVTYSVVDSHGKAAAEVTIQVTVKNDLPVIAATDKEVPVNGFFNPLEGVTATDKQDGDLTSEIQVTSNDVDMTTPGTYSVTYEVTDKNGGKVAKTVVITVEAAQI
ncbi:immunoglobulin-like domain-containing protein [Listeria monocytogenes]